MTETPALKRINVDRGTAVKVFAIALVAVTVIVPLFFILAELGGEGVASVLRNRLFGRAVLNSVFVTFATTLLSMGFSFMLAYLISRSNIRFKGIFSVIITVPMLIPSIAHGMGLVILLGENGIITNILKIDSNIYGFVGIMLGAFMYSFPTAFLMFMDVFRYEDRMPYRVADIMGIPGWRQFKDITLPYLAKPLISVFFATFTIIFTDYGVPLMISGQFMTLPLFMYNEVIGQLNFGAGALSSIVLIVPAIVACVFDLLTKDVSNMNTVLQRVPNRENKTRDAITYAICAVSFIIVAFPVVSYGVIGLFKKYPSDMTFGLMNLRKLWGMGLGKFLIDSLVIAFMASIAGTFLGAATAYLTARTRRNWSNGTLHVLALISLAIPGIVLGLSYLLMYRGTFLSRSIFILVLLNIVHFFSSPYLMCYNAFNKINGNYEVIVKTLQIKKGRYFVDILFPEIEDTLLEMFSYIFVNSMVTISAVAFLSNAKNLPLALLINQLEGQALLECAAMVAVIILFVNVIVKSAVYFIKLGRSFHRAKE